MSGWRSTPLPPDWRKRRAAVLERDGSVCRRCGATATDVDHMNGPDDHRMLSLQSLCRRCHYDVTRARQAQHARRRQPEAHPGLL